jgi:hypothetical protein
MASLQQLLFLGQDRQLFDLNARWSLRVEHAMGRGVLSGQILASLRTAVQELRRPCYSPLKHTRLRRRMATSFSDAQTHVIQRQRVAKFMRHRNAGMRAAT